MNGFEGDAGVFVDVMISRAHSNSTVRVTLFKRNDASSPWVEVDTNRASELMYGTYYQAQFNRVRGDKQCKARARWSAPNHNPSTMTHRFGC